MSTSTVRSLDVAVEAAYGSPGATGVPTSAALTYRPLAFESASLAQVGGAFELDEDDTAAASPLKLPPEVVTSWDGGARVNRQTGSIDVTVRVQGYGAGGIGSSSADMPLAMLWASGLRRVGTSGATVAVAGAAAANLVQLGSGGAAAFAGAEGEVVLSAIDGCVVANRIVEVDDVADQLVMQHEWPRALDTGDSIQRGIGFTVGTGPNTGLTGPSVAMRLRTLHGEMEAFGCRLASLTLTAPNGHLVAAMSIRAAFIRATAEETPIAVGATPRLASARCTLRGAALRVGTASSEGGVVEAGPVTGAATELEFEHDGWQIAIENELEPVGTGCGAVGEADCEVASTSVTLSFTRRRVDTFGEGLNADILARRARTICQAAAPISDGATSLNGWGFSMPAAALSEAANVDASGPLLSQALNYVATDYRGDVPGAGNVFAMYLGGSA